MANEEKRVLVEKLADRKVARITLNRPDKHNALDLAMIEQWMAALEDIRKDDGMRVVLTRAAGPSFGSGLDLFYLRSMTNDRPPDWDRGILPRQLADTLRDYPKVTVAQVHGYCLGQAMVNMLSHDLVFAAKGAKIGMPEIVRGSFGQLATANLFHAGVPLKKAAFIQLTAQLLSGEEADRLGLISLCVEDGELEDYALRMASEIASRHPGALASAKIAVRMGADLSVAEAMKMDLLVGAWQRQMVDHVGDIENYLSSQSGGGQAEYKRPDS